MAGVTPSNRLVPLWNLLPKRIAARQELPRECFRHHRYPMHLSPAAGVDSPAGDDAVSIIVK